MYVDSLLKMISSNALPLGMLHWVLRMISGTRARMYAVTIGEMVKGICRYIGSGYTIHCPRNNAREVVLHRLVGIRVKPPYAR
jgi:hypothetical protein